LSSSPPSLRRLLPAYRPLVPSTIMRARRQVQRVRDAKSLRRLLPAYRPLVPSTIMCARRQVQQVRDEKFPSVYCSRQSSDGPTNTGVPERQHLDWSPGFINPVYRSPPRKIARTTTGPTAYAPLLVQRALALGACSHESQAWAGKASFPDSAICEQTSYMSKRPLPSLFLSYGSRQRAELHKHLPFAQKLSAYAQVLVQRALVMGPAVKKPKNGPRASSPDLTCEGLVDGAH